ncbi:hypothetical protein [Aquiflexum gelatinilyticum]|uniref:Uncharacterized protein n=1 Tax=Aquiflexum gelatinilyticum TaxID=2961943 RepID=A0A9X2T0A6_9BACT|nr:hypothetical protein [Aquiflexum gelatinilyticum]MCR9013670.1 hypothetical protein [Aquiflexum gelatinilyticum]MCS4433602.1 hypothetical protein [Aquiflexum gelatinilyticum]
MQGKVSPIFRLFTQQFEDAKSAFLSLSKRYRGKKSMELEQKLIFLEIYVDFLSRIHFKEENLKFQLFSPFKKIFKGLKKTKHLKMIMKQVESVKMRDNVVFNSYTKALESEKNKVYAEVYDLIVSTPLQIWDELYNEVYQYSRGLKPLMVNTSTTQIISEELEFFNLDNKTKLDTKALKDIYEGIRVIIALENLRIESGFNSIFVKEVHVRMSELQKDLLVWYQNQLFLQHLTGFLTDKEDISKKYIDLLASLQQNKKINTAKVETKCRELFERILE